MYASKPNGSQTTCLFIFQHFHRFIEVLTERGVDMRKVKISKAEAALWG